MQLATFLLLANFHQNPYLKNMISTYIGRILHEKNGPNSPDLKKYIFYQSPDFYYKFPVGSQKYNKILMSSYFTLVKCDQIWLNHFGDDK
jgi:hypothetical protein